MLDEALAAGWNEQEIVTATMELANAWYFGRAENRATDAAIVRAAKTGH